jgi:glucan phosphoethanolaminetransferase (alkaline phosphatase superfamily)
MRRLFKILMIWIVLAVAVYSMVNYFYVTTFTTVDITGAIVTPEGGEFIGIIAVAVFSILFGLILLQTMEKGSKDMQ